jgi:hypothetical protein
VTDPEPEYVVEFVNTASKGFDPDVAAELKSAAGK